MNRRSISLAFLWTAAAALASGCGRGDGFTLSAGLVGGINGGPAGGASGSGGTGGGNGGEVGTGASGGTFGSNGGGRSNGTPGGTGIGGLTSGGPGGSGAGTGGATAGTTGGRACQTLDDCPDLETICLEGVCTLNLCGASSKPGHQNGELDGRCGVQGTDDGSCIPTDLNGTPVGLCSQGGAADAGCDVEATRPSGLANACEAGDVCLFEPGGAQCFVLCDPIPAESTCAPGDKCVRPLQSNQRLGVCQPEGASTTGGTGGATGGTGGTGGSTNGGTGGTGGDCNPNIGSIELQACASTSDCGCPYTCVDDSVAGRKLCEYPCKAAACFDPGTVCITATETCGLVACGAGTGNGSFNSTCTMPNGDQGTCGPVTFDGINSVGLCQLAGTATKDCDPNPLLTDQPSQLCVPGSLCFGGFGHADGTCNQLCDPAGSAICPDTQICFFIVDEPDLGICSGQE